MTAFELVGVSKFKTATLSPPEDLGDSSNKKFFTDDAAGVEGGVGNPGEGGGGGGSGKSAKGSVALLLPLLLLLLLLFLSSLSSSSSSLSSIPSSYFLKFSSLFLICKSRVLGAFR